jgi:hypothetical protein
VIEIAVAPDPAAGDTLDLRHFDDGIRTRRTTEVADEIVRGRNEEVPDFHEAGYADKGGLAISAENLLLLLILLLLLSDRPSAPGFE